MTRSERINIESEIYRVRLRSNYLHYLFSVVKKDLRKKIVSDEEYIIKGFVRTSIDVRRKNTNEKRRAVSSYLLFIPKFSEIFILSRAKIINRMLATALAILNAFNSF